MYRVMRMLGSYPTEKMNAFSVSTLVNSPTNNSEDAIKGTYSL